MTAPPRLAHALAALRDQLDAAFPTRSKASDGWIGNAAHQAEGDYTVSQHNPNPDGVVCAIDVTEDPAAGVDCQRLMDELAASRDPRIFYVIYNHQIDNSDGTRTPYIGPDPHTSHLHISTRYDHPELYDDPRPWALPMLTTSPKDDDDVSMANDPDLRGAITEITGNTRSTNGEVARTATRLDGIEKLLTQLIASGGHPVVDEKALAGYLAPLLIGHVGQLASGDLHNLTAALVTETGKRLVTATPAAPEALADPQATTPSEHPAYVSDALANLGMPDYEHEATTPAPADHFVL